MIKTDLDFPKSLPAPLLSSGQITLAPTYDRAQFAAGNSRNIPGFDYVPEYRSLEFVLTRDQLAVFTLWYRKDADNGAKAFNIRVLTELGHINMACKFAASGSSTPYTREPITPGVWRLAFPVEYTERQTIPIDWPSDSEWLYRKSELDVLVNLVWPLRLLQDYQIERRLIGVSNGVNKNFYALTPNNYTAISINSIEKIELDGPLGRSSLNESGSQNLCIQSNFGNLWPVPNIDSWYLEPSQIGLGDFLSITGLQTAPGLRRIYSSKADVGIGEYTLSFFIEIDPLDVGECLVYPISSAFGEPTSFRLKTTDKTTYSERGGVVSSSIEKIIGNTYRVAAHMNTEFSANDAALFLAPVGKSGRIKIGGVQVNKGHSADYPIETDGSAVIFNVDYTHKDGLIELKPKIKSGTKIIFSGEVVGYKS